MSSKPITSNCSRVQSNKTTKNITKATSKPRGRHGRNQPANKCPTQVYVISKHVFDYLSELEEGEIVETSEDLVHVVVKTSRPAPWAICFEKLSTAEQSKLIRRARWLQDPDME
jgi:gamma-glutamylcyclotransferase (GGCT)/AIG2-like uncharacterized protein YtfP